MMELRLRNANAGAACRRKPGICDSHISQIDESDPTQVSMSGCSSGSVVKISFDPAIQRAAQGDHNRFSAE